MTAPLIVLGSANTDYMVRVDRHPLPGETVLGTTLVVSTGGKGANQALAAARSGASPMFLGAVGADENGRQILQSLLSGGVDASQVATVDDVPTGIALITVSRSGENSIVVAPGANTALSPSDVVSSTRTAGGRGTVLLAQLEIPLSVVEAAAEAVAELGGRTVLNLSPSRHVTDDLLRLCDPLVVNAAEAQDITGMPVNTVDEAQIAATSLSAICPSVVITLGAAGAVFADEGGIGHVPAPRVKVVDTTGAGDAFAGALVASLASRRTLRAAVESGVAAGAAAIEWWGAQPPQNSAS